MSTLTVQQMLNSERLIMRAPQASDLQAYQAYCASPRSSFVGGPFDTAKAFEKFTAMAGHWIVRGFGRYVMLKDGIAIGHVGPLCMDESVAPEFTWTLWDGAYEGQGYATEAASTVWQHLTNDCQWKEMVIRIVPDNTKSCRIAERLGAILTDEAAPVWYPDSVTYRLYAGAA
ncbi:RimJ/RimL family protein N-acetyltransferase [Sulfitobacter undariae]|uniref:RimJ/RimL family protein N-acetyltransferase n=1 Tax=Sulfitobacter undariae TaxID=1563671 RepID=A0A7W6E357_9RHOB|nr:GNAT family N-acetyltransferase [Sulfitobacter undariae]MBB3992606.1 RimJ/RimL family protein N-acetyltransferase [Sulfitobacter undariae]